MGERLVKRVGVAPGDPDIAGMYGNPSVDDVVRSPAPKVKLTLVVSVAP